ncbi:MAG: DHH family phosphoesterase [Lachnospiraceae bacterium]|nr:DHH family phosphoesterase [Lachnospiraceae bacterium]
MTRSIKLKGRLKSYMQLPLFLTILLIVLNVPMYFWDVRAGVVVSVFLVIYIIVVAITYNSYKPVLVNELINFATQYGTVQKKLINEFEIPYALLDYNGRVLWVNEKFTELTGKDKRFHKSISTIFPGITKELIRQEENIESLDVVWEDHYFRVKMNKIFFEEMMESSQMVELHQAEEYLTAVYLFDETQLNQCRQENEDQKLVASLVYIDNYEEALNSIEDVKRSLLIALIERKINKYFSQMDGLVRKIEKDKFFVVFQHKYLAQMEENKFSLLEDVKTVKVGNEMAVTLSIGIGVMGATYTQNYEYARMAIDLALGRGGDQVVLKKGGEISYYGGNTKQVDKNTRVKARVKAHALREILESKEHVMIMGHSIPDVDAFGAAVGIYCAAKVLGKHAQIVINEVTSSLRPIKDSFTVDHGYPEDLFLTSERALDAIDSNTLVVVVDTNRPSYTECPDLLKRAKSVVVFDHHRQGSEVIKNPLLSYIEPYASSTCEMIAEVLQYFSENIKLTPEEADCIYAGILIDTSNFMTKTGVRTFEAAAYLRRCGAEVTRVRKMLQNNMSDYKARAEVIRHAQVYRGSFAISICPAGEIESPTVVGAQAANELLNIIGIRASFVLTEYQGKIYVSSRSIDEINVQRIMERLGGGGHMNTAGCQIQGCSLKQAEKLIEDTIDEMIEEGDIKE